MRRINDCDLEVLLRDCAKWWAVCFTQYDSIPCGHFRPEFKSAAEVLFAFDLECYEIDASENPTICEELEVSAVPTVLLYHRTELICRFEGPYSSGSLVRRIREAMKARKS